MNDNDLGETDPVTLATGDAQEVKSTPRRLPYVLHQELEKEMVSKYPEGKWKAHHEESMRVHVYK